MADEFDEIAEQLARETGPSYRRMATPGNFQRNLDWFYRTGVEPVMSGANRQLFETDKPKLIPGPAGGLINNVVDLFSIPLVPRNEILTLGNIANAGTYALGALGGPALKTAQGAITPAVIRGTEAVIDAGRRAAPVVGGLAALSPSEAEAGPEKIPQGFLSVLREAISGSKQKAMPPEQWNAYLVPGKRTVTKDGMTFPLRQDELEFSGIPEFLASKPKGQKVDIIDMLSELDKRTMPSFIDQGLGAVERAERLEASNIASAKVREAERRAAIAGFDRERDVIQKEVFDKMGVTGFADPRFRNRLNEYQKLAGDRLDEVYRRQADWSKARLKPSDEVRPATYETEETYRLPGLHDGYEENLTKWGHLDKKNLDRLRELGHKYENEGLSPKEVREWKTLQAAYDESFTPDKGHFESEPGLLSHSRATRRKTPDGAGVRQVEELQSDWHQQARDEGGYRGLTGLEENEYQSLRKRWLSNDRERMTPEEISRYRQLAHRVEDSGDITETGSWHPDQRPPRAPFKDTYSELEFKKQILKAIEDGDEYVAWTTGQQQIDRYSGGLKRHVAKIDWLKNSDGTYTIIPMKHDGTELGARRRAGQGIDFNEFTEKTKGLTPKEVQNLLGKEMSKEILENGGRHGTIEGDGLTVGGSGMRHYYDTKVRDMAQKLAKQYGGELTEVPIPGGPTHTVRPVKTVGSYGGSGGYDVIDVDGNTRHFDRVVDANQYAKKMNARSTQTQPAIHITPEMREKVKKTGFSMFTRPEAVVAAGATGAAMSPSPEDQP